MPVLPSATPPAESPNPEELYKDVHKAGGMTWYRMDDDPRHLVFYLSRYKHTAKLLEGCKRVLEIGCGDGIGSRIVRQHVDELVAIDSDHRSIAEANKHNWKANPIRFRNISFEQAILGTEPFDAVFCLDVLEHINPKDESFFLSKMRGAAPVAIIGTPSLESQVYASRLSKEGHVNCKSGEGLRSTLRNYWSHVFMFSMHDETLGTSYLPMSQYLLALCVE